jgi:cell fate regulator YaaT (PSP1 superfamily)
MTKMQDEVKALQLCQNKVRQKKLPMEVVDAEYQWWVFCLFCGLTHFFF